MPISALPEHLRDVENHFPDDDQYNNVPIFGKLYRWYQKRTKTWFCFSYRCTEWWARWRKIPFVVAAIKGEGPWRFEQHGSLDGGGLNEFRLYSRFIRPFSDFGQDTEWYLSRIQYYTRWHLAVQWPLMVSCHFYFKASDVPKYGEPRPDSDGKLFYFYWNHFDADLVYWMVTSIFIGTGWK